MRGFISLFFAITLLFSVESFTVDSFVNQHTILGVEDAVCSSNEQNLFEFGPSHKQQEQKSLKMVIWNVQKYEDAAAIYDVQSILQQSDILMLQEAMLNDFIYQKLNGKTEHAFHFYRSFCTDYGATGVMTVVRGVVAQNKNIFSPGCEPIVCTPKVTGYSLVQTAIGPIHLLNTHALNFNLGDEFREQIDNVADFIRNLHGPIVWAGDFNTWSEGRHDYLKKVTKDLGLTHVRPQKDNRYMQLDHIFIRGLKAKKAAVRGETSSDHYPLEVTIEEK